MIQPDPDKRATPQEAYNEWEQILKSPPPPKSTRLSLSIPPLPSIRQAIASTRRAPSSTQPAPSSVKPARPSPAKPASFLEIQAKPAQWVESIPVVFNVLMVVTLSLRMATL